MQDAGRTLVPALARQPGHLFWRAAARVNAALADVLPPGVDIHAYATLLALAGGVTRSQQALADTVSVSRTTMVKVGARLAAEGLVTRVRKPGDRRTYALARTPEGADAARRWRRHAEDLEDAITAGFSIAEREELCGMLRRVAADELAHDTPGPLLDSVGFLVTRVHFLLHRGFLEALAPLDLEPRHVGAMTALEAAGPVSQSALARMLGVSAASVVQIVDDLERRGLVERRRLEVDRRTQLLHLRPGAAALAERAREIGGSVMDERLAALDREERDRLVALMVRFVTAP